jgi:hypothetical protein
MRPVGIELIDLEIPDLTFPPAITLWGLALG